jgi:TonB family protein
MKRVALVVAACVLAGASVLASPEQDQFASARDLYASANYEEALNVLNRLRGTQRGLAEELAIQQYRAFCLLALGRSADAEQTIEALVALEPTYQPSDADVSPRLRVVFADVRRRVLPPLVQRRYAEAKGAFDRKDYAAAVEGFDNVLRVLGDPELAKTAAQPPLADIRTLAAGFHDLSVAATTPPPAPPAPEPVASPVTQPAPMAMPAANRIFGADDLEVVPPGIVTQTLPAFPQNVRTGARGVLEVVIDEAGQVESAVMRVPLSPLYDGSAVSAARNWKFRPATVQGVPVKFRKMVQVLVQR